MDPAAYADSGTEHGEQTALFMWLQQSQKDIPEFGLAFAIPNGGERNIKVAAHLKAEGVKRGVLDIMFPVARHGYHGLFVEMKRRDLEGTPTGGLSEFQENWIKALVEQGYAVRVCYGFDQAREVFLAYMSNQGG